MYGRTWPNEAVYGYTWPDVAIYARYGRILPYMVVNGLIWPYVAMATFGHALKHCQTWPAKYGNTPKQDSGTPY